MNKRTQSQEINFISDNGFCIALNENSLSYFSFEVEIIPGVKVCSTKFGEYYHIIIAV